MNIKTILITGARSLVALDLSRLFHAAGFQVICADNLSMSICRFSGTVAKFYTIAPPATEFEQFVKDIQTIVQRHQVHLIVPTCEEVFYLAQAKHHLDTSVFCDSIHQLERLHNKWTFYQLLLECGYHTPQTHLLTESRDSIEPSGKWVIKPSYSRFAAKIHVVENNWPILEDSSENPLIVQRFIEGEKLCSYSICQNGVVTAHGTYKVLHSMGLGAAICFESIHAPEVQKFVTEFVKKINFTGQIAFDFIQSDQLYCLECNPRATSGVHLFEGSPSLARAFLKQEPTQTPKIGTVFHDHLFMLWFGMKQRELFSKRFWSHFLKGKSPIWKQGDLQVTIGSPLAILEIAYLTLFKRQRFNQAMTSGIEYNGANP